MHDIILKQGCEKRLQLGHKWIFSNEISGTLKEKLPGWVKIFSHKGAFLGTGYLNPKTLISIRIFTRQAYEPDRNFFLTHFKEAYGRRKKIYPDSSAYRVVFGESDFLPGLIIDKYADVFVYQANTLCMSEYESRIQDCIIELFNPSAVVFRNDSKMRVLEGLPQEKGVAWGRLQEKTRVKMNGLDFDVDVLSGQKTGLFLDQRDNREAIKKYANGRNVIDFFCYDGAWSLAAKAGGAMSSTGIDSSLPAIERARNNAEINNLDCTFIQDDALAALKKLDRNSHDMIILDPPAFAKSRKDLDEAVKGYIDINRRALLALNQGGILVSCSCSYNINVQDFYDIILSASRAAGRELRLLEVRGQALDHPILLGMPETAYLKCLILEVA